jgi:hypothetical protein
MIPDFIENPPEFLKWLDDLGVTYFASGANHPGEILGLASVGINPGVTVSEIGAGALEAIDSLSKSQTLLFVDSGAFGEVTFSKKRPPYVKPKNAITHAKWMERLNIYNQIAQSLGPQAYLVAPDKVAFQSETFERQRRYAGYVQHLAELGANILVPLQKGKLSLFECYLESLNILELPQMIAAIPMKKDATKLSELVEFLQDAVDAGGAIDRLHLLGIGPKSKQARKILNAVFETSPDTEVFMDSVLITSIVGRTGGKLRGPRPLTVASDAAMYDLGMAVLTGRVPDVPQIDGFVERFDELATDAAQAHVQREWGSIQEAPFLELYELYNGYIQAVSTAWRKATSIERLFGEDARPLDADWQDDLLKPWKGHVSSADISRELDWLAARLADWIYHPTGGAFYPPMVQVEYETDDGEIKKRWVPSYEAVDALEEALRRSRLYKLRKPMDASELWMYVSKPLGPDDEWVLIVEAVETGADRIPVVRLYLDEA